MHSNDAALCDDAVSQQQLIVKSPKAPSLRELDASAIEYFPSETLKPVPSPDAHETQSHQAFTDHMVTVSWTQTEGWHAPRLVAYGPLQLAPSVSVIQYATSCFEGMKVFRGHDGRLRLFRPELNCERMRRSAHRISLPQPDAGQLLELIKRFCQYECPKWLPEDQPGFDVPQEAQLIIFACYWPILHPKKQQRGLRLKASAEDEIRAWPNGTGSTKLAANYGPSLLSHSAAKQEGYDQVLWLYGDDCQVTEAGSTNFFVIWRTKTDQKLQLVTAALDSGLILPGVTRQTVLDLARERLSACIKGQAGRVIEEVEVVERSFTMFDIIEACESDRLESVFSVGTAFFINPVSSIRFGDRDIVIPTGRLPHLDILREWVTGIMYGQEQSSWTHVIENN